MSTVFSLNHRRFISIGQRRSVSTCFLRSSEIFSGAWDGWIESSFVVRHEQRLHWRYDSVLQPLCPSLIMIDDMLQLEHLYISYRRDLDFSQRLHVHIVRVCTYLGSLWPLNSFSWCGNINTSKSGDLKTVPLKSTAHSTGDPARCRLLGTVVIHSSLFFRRNSCVQERAVGFPNIKFVDEKILLVIIPEFSTYPLFDSTRMANDLLHITRQ